MRQITILCIPDLNLGTGCAMGDSVMYLFTGDGDRKSEALTQCLGINQSSSIFAPSESE